MIKANELRIGNKVMANRFEDDEPWETTVEEIQDMQITASLIPRGGTWVKYEDLEPIPLTPEWLERSGFRKDMGGGGGLLEFENGFICFYDMNNPLVGYSGVSDELINGGPIHNLNYVHQLQNLYFALTGEELTIKS